MGIGFIGWYTWISINYTSFSSFHSIYHMLVDDRIHDMYVDS